MRRLWRNNTQANLSVGKLLPFLTSGNTACREALWGRQLFLYLPACPLSQVGEVLVPFSQTVTELYRNNPEEKNKPYDAT